jgi:hypothetical membrane protein
MLTQTAQRIGAAFGIAAPILAFTCILGAIVSYPAFSWTINALSDLGVISGITGMLFNFGLCAGGVLGFIFAVFGLYHYLGKSAVGKIGAGVFGFAALALFCIGVFNEGFVPTHYLVSVLFFVSSPIALFILTCAFWLSGRRGLAVFSVLVGVVAALPWILFFTLNYVPNVAVPETVSGLAVGLWAVVLGKKML